MTMSWRELNSILADLNEETILNMLNEERAGERRATVLVRLHQRYTILRAARERSELLEGITFPKVAALV
ncbi:MAG: hypothetical protein AMJ66_11365 [Betaproteobacteria bacterium SG8_40]|nr:MAG: hypothetical protein AMJ66_11365 [Betaproteobacteria bacterium SG8_40]